MKLIRYAGAIFMILAAFLTENTAYGQTQPLMQVVSPPAPEVAALGKFGLVPVDYFTGVPNIAVPVYTVHDGTLSFPISLKYHAGGIKVKEDASEVGLGWALSAGGSIVSVVRGQPDLPSGFLNTYQVMPDSPSVISKTRNSLMGVNNWYYMWENDVDRFSAMGYSYYIYSGLSLPHNGVATELFNYFTVGYQGQAPDLASDLYIITIGERSYKFVFDNNLHPVVLGDGSLKIEMIPNGLYPDWKVTDEQGIVYYFTQRQFSYSNTTDPAISPSAPATLNTWMLTKIVSPTYGEIDFKYLASRTVFNHPLPNLSETYLVGNPSPDIQQTVDMVTPNFTQYDQVNIDSIQFSNGHVKFFYDNQPRADLQGAKRLSAIEIRDKNQRFIKRINFWNNDYFVGSGGAGGNTAFQSAYNNLTNYTADNHTKRLKLDSLGEVDSTGNVFVGKYAFTYNQTVNLPDKLSLAVDHWGYYNGQANPQLVPPATLYLSTQSSPMTYTGANRTAVPAYAQANTLTSVKYPTGGTESYTYETNQFIQAANVTTTKDSLIDSYYKAAGSSTQNESGVLDANGNFTAPASWNGKKLSIFCLVFRNSSDPTTDQLNIVVKQGGVLLKSIATGTSGTSVIDSTIVIQGGATYNISYDAYSTAFFNNCEIRRSIYVLQGESSTSQQQVVNYSGGLRVSSIVDYDPVTNKTLTKNYAYFNGTEDDIPIYNSQEGEDVWGDPINQSSNVFRYRYGQAIYPFSDGRDAPYFGYGQVQVTESDGSNVNGMTEYDYNTSGSIDANTMLNTNSNFKYTLIINPIMAPIPVITQGRGEKLAEKVYKYVNGTPALVSKNDYYYTIANTTKIWQMVFNQGLSEFFGNYTNAGRYFKIYAHQFAIPVNRNMLSGKDHFEYDATGNPTVNTFENYTYDQVNGHYQIIKKTTGDSKGDTINTYYKYPQDYVGLASQSNLDTTALGVLNLQQAHVVTPVEKYDQLIPAINTAPKEYYGALLNTYKTTMPVLNQVLTINNIGPLSSFSFSNVTNGSFSKNSLYENRVRFLNYDTQGHLLTQEKQSGPATAYQWGYNGQYPVAAATNASSSNIFYDSFEEGDGNTASGNGYTGHYSYAGTTYSHALSGLSGGNYVLTYWLKAASTGLWSMVVSNLSGIGTSYNISITIPTGGQIDDVRFYPANALMTTYTYDSLIGMTSSMDAKGEVSYYEYDTFQRLMNIKDKDGNIIKHFDYHYQWQ